MSVSASSSPVPCSSSTRSPFTLPERLRAKTDPALIAADEAHFARIQSSLDRDISDLTTRLDTERRAPGVSGEAALERDLQIHRLSARLRTLRRFGLDLCLGRMVPADESEPVYIGRLGLTDAGGVRLLTDWRSPAAEPFFGATLADPMGLASRRRYRWTRGSVTDYWDEAFTTEGFDSNAALDDQSAFIASLGASRSSRMRDVLATLQADQDAIIRAGARGALVVDGGPGTGKTVVALHRAAYLLYTDPHLERRNGGVLFIGPSRSYLSYVADVLPGLGEEGVHLATVPDLVPEGGSAEPETDAQVARLKGDARLVDAVEAAVCAYEEPPTSTLTVSTAWLDVEVEPELWRAAFDAADPSGTHNGSRDEVWAELLALLVDHHDDGSEGLTSDELLRELQQDPGLRRAFARAWPVLDPAGIVADLWSRPALLRACAPWLTAQDALALHRIDSASWTTADLPLLDAARRRIGDPGESRRRREAEAMRLRERERMAAVVDDLIAADDGEGLVTMLRGDDVKNSLDDESILPPLDPNRLGGPFAHLVVDEAQELTDAEWRMLIARCPSLSVTVVGDRAQARHGFPESWEERLTRVGLRHVQASSLTINYRTPREVMAVAEPAIRAVLPDANVPTSIRASGIPVRHGSASEAEALLDDWLAQHDEGTACVIGDPGFAPRPRVAVLSPEHAKGLEFDLVVLVAPDALGTGIEAGVDRYVAMTRSTRELAVLH